MIQEQDINIHIQAPEREFSAPLHFIVYNDAMQIIAASYIGYETSVKAISAGITEKRTTWIDKTYFYSLTGKAYRFQTKPIGIGDIHHGMIFSRNAIWNDIFEDETENKKVDPIIFAPDGEIKKAVSKFVKEKYALTDLFNNWEELYYDMIPEEKIRYFIVKSNPNYPIWNNLKAVQIDITEEEILNIITKGMKNKFFQISKTNELIQGSYYPEMKTTKDFVTSNVQALAQKLSKVRPHHDFDDPIHWSIRLMGRTPFPMQAHKIQGLANALRTQNNTFDCGDMGTGKSISLCGTILVSHETARERGRTKGTSVLLSAPSITIPKWKEKEILPTLPHHAKVEIINSTEDAIRLLNKIRSGHKPHKNDIEFYLIALDRAKLGHEPYFSGIWKRISTSKNDYAWHCPDCFTPIQIDIGEGETKDADWNDFVSRSSGIPSPETVNLAKGLGYFTSSYLTGINQDKDLLGQLLPNGVPHGLIAKWNTQGTPRKCSCCHASLWRPALKQRGETRNRPRYNISRILKKSKRWFDFFAQDEVQQAKAEDSGRGDAFGQMIKASKKQQFMTGTITNGKSTSIKEILWRSDAKALLDDGFNDQSGSIQWAKRYGSIKEIKHINEEIRGTYTRQRRRALQPKEEIGISPQLTAHHLLHKAAFTELSDLGLPLVEIHEIPVIVPLDPTLEGYYHQFHSKLERECKKLKQWGSFNPATINYADRPDKEITVRFRDFDSETGYSYIQSEPLPHLKKHNKVKKLIDIVKSELKEERGCIIYNNYTDSYGMNEYIQDILQEEGIESEILSTSTSTLQRFEWLQKQEEKGTKVIICNLSLVEVGLDLMPWPTIIYYQSNYDINKVRQSSRRHWRLGQYLECRTYFMVYEHTQQMHQFITLMNKRAHALLVEGRIDKSELAEFSTEGHDSLASNIAQTLDSSSFAEKWRKLSKMDIDENLELVAESEFKHLLQAKMKELADKTLSLCLPLPAHVHSVKKEKAIEDWIQTLFPPVQRILEPYLPLLTDKIESIHGFSIRGDQVHFDKIQVFGFNVDDYYIQEYLFEQLELKKTVAEDSFTIEIHPNKKGDSLIKVITHETKKNRKLAIGQLAFDF